MSTINRRSFFKLGALATGGFILTAEAQQKGKKQGANSKETTGPIDFPSDFVKILPTGEIILTSHIPEIGQGIKTSLPMIIAEELDVTWDKVKVITKAADANTFGRQLAGGSQSTPQNYQNLRELGAAAKHLLISAAAKKWGVSPTQCSASNGVVSHSSSDKSHTYGELATDAAKLQVPDLKDITLKNPKDFELIGKRITGVDNHEIVSGKPLFGIDQVQPDMKYASYTRCPSFSGEVKSANIEEIKKMPGVFNAFILKGAPSKIGGLSGGVAIIADSTWNAWKAKDALKIEWDTPDASQHSTKIYNQKAEALAKKNKQQIEGAIEGFYHYPLLAHNPLEPQNCSALYKNGKILLWSPTQAPAPAKDAIARILNLDKSDIEIHVTRSGGGFGRRINTDFSVEAAAIAKAQEGIPVKLTWTREQDIQQDFYRNACWHMLQGKVDENGKITNLTDHAIALGADEKTPGTGGKMSTKMFPFPFIKNSKISQSTIPSNVPFGWWRAPGSNGFAFALQCFLDELAHKAGKDPVDFRMEILNTKGKGYDAERMIGALQAATKKANWGKKLPKGSAQGVAFYFSHRGYVAVVAEVTVSKDGKLTVDKLTAGVDVGPIINLSGAENQVQGSMLDGLSSAWYQEIVIENGAVQNNNFHDYELLRMPEAADIEIEFVKSDASPTGLGEPALPPAIPAVCNAIFSATGKRIRTLPISKNDLSWS